MRDDRSRLEDMLEAVVEQNEKYTARGRPAFDRDELVQTWSIRHC